MNESPAPELTICKCCGKELRWYPQCSHFYGECTDRFCDRFAITRELHDLAELSQDVIDSFHAASRRSDALTVDLSAYL